MQERWDIEVLFRSRSMPTHKPFVYKGPQISIGSSPGVGGMQLSNSTIAPIHARIECYTGNKVMIHPIQHNEVRVATHEGEDWSRIDPIYKPVPLLPGVAVYIGPIGHGVLFVFLQAKLFWLISIKTSCILTLYLFGFVIICFLSSDAARRGT